MTAVRSDALHRGRSVPPSLPKAYLLDVFNHVAQSDVPTSKYDGPLLYLRATAGDPNAPTLTQFVTGPAAIVDVACDHHSLVQPPFAAEAATAMSAAMVRNACIARERPADGRAGSVT